MQAHREKRAGCLCTGCCNKPDNRRGRSLQKIESILLDIKKSIKIKRKDFEALLYGFLEEILFMLDAENFLISRISSIKISNKFDLKATIIGDRASEYEFTNPVKAVTYNEMFVRKEKVPSDKDENKKVEVWIAQAVLDV